MSYVTTSIDWALGDCCFLLMAAIDIRGNCRGRTVTACFGSTSQTAIVWIPICLAVKCEGVGPWVFGGADGSRRTLTVFFHLPFKVICCNK